MLYLHPILIKGISQIFYCKKNKKMKKVFLFAIAAVAISFASCNGASSNKTDETAKDSANVTPEVVVNETEVVAVDSLNGDTIVAGEVSVGQAPASK